MKKIVLCATQRSGSTMICEDMRNAKVFGLPEEYFIPWVERNPDSDYYKELDILIEEKSSANGVFAVKVMGDQLSSIESCLTQDEEAVADSQGRICPHFFEQFADAEWVYIVRRDTLRQAISQVMAAQTGFNHATNHASDEHFAGKLLKGYSNEYNRRVRYSFNAIRRVLFKLAEDNAIWLKFFSDWKISPYIIEYEENNKTTLICLEDISRRVGIDFNGQMSERKMVKLSNKKNDEWYDQFVNDLLLSRKIIY